MAMMTLVYQNASQQGHLDANRLWVLNRFGNVDYCLQALLQAWRRHDPMPAWVKPLPLSLIRLAVSQSACGLEGLDPAHRSFLPRLGFLSR